MLPLCLRPRHENLWGSGRIASHVLNFNTRWRWVISFTPRPFYPLGRSPRYLLYRRLNGSKSLAEEDNLFLLPGIEPRFLIRRARSLVDISGWAKAIMLIICKTQFAKYCQGAEFNGDETVGTWGMWWVGRTCGVGWKVGSEGSYRLYLAVLVMDQMKGSCEHGSSKRLGIVWPSE
jgi:hypothetical protein